MKILKNPMERKATRKTLIQEWIKNFLEKFLNLSYNTVGVGLDRPFNTQYRLLI